MSNGSPASPKSRPAGRRTWVFLPRFRRDAYSWRSDLPRKRLQEALAEIRAVARKDAIAAAEGAVLLVERLSPALTHVDDSSGALGTAVRGAIDELVLLIAAAPVPGPHRDRWLRRLWQALLDDEMPWIESLGDHWGALCADPDTASRWADEMLPTLRSVWRPDAQGHGFFQGTGACLSSLHAAGRHEELLALLESPRTLGLWHYRQWGARALLTLGRPAEAIRYAEASRSNYSDPRTIDRFCEDVLLASGLREEAYRRYALSAHRGTTNLATLRAVAKAYPERSKETILRDLIATTPGEEGKWFAAAKDTGMFPLAIELAQTSPTDPRTLIRACRDYASRQPDFALAAGLAALRWIARGYGYEITTLDVLQARESLVIAAREAGMEEAQMHAGIRDAMAGGNPGGLKFVQSALGSS